MSEETATAVESIVWKDDHVRIIDQTYLPKRKVYSDIRDMGRMWEAIKKASRSGGACHWYSSRVRFLYGH